ncbi:MAG TPA: hypothetical protein VFL83_10515 [Anaeromyxobacter sp.]|nr:hypothetical protein [Anaeromyxobacter sp.]
MSERTEGSPPRRLDRLFVGALLVEWVAAAGILWATPFLPMQDLPQHLFQAEVTRSFDDPALDWKAHFTCDARFGPYALAFLALRAITALAPVEAAVRVLLTLTLGVYVAIALAVARDDEDVASPWPLLLVVPLFFQPIFHLGFLPLVVATPIALLAAIDLRTLVARGPARRRLARHAALLGATFLGHPYAALVYAVLALLLAASHARAWRRGWPALAAGLLMLGALAAWYALTFAPVEPGQVSRAGGPWPWKDRLEFLLLPFTGMRIRSEPGWWDAALWAVAIGASIAFAARSLRGARPGSATLWLAACVAGFFLLPSWQGNYSYFNVRLGAFANVLLCVLLTRAPIPARIAPGFAAVSLALLALAGQRSIEVSRETEELVPLLAQMERNRTVFPLVLDSRTRALDPVYFYEMHQHAPFYYHVRVGGGATPALFPNSMQPVQYRPGVRMLELPLDGLGVWYLAYDYVLVRGAPRRLLDVLARNATFSASSGRWALFSRVARPIAAR